MFRSTVLDFTTTTAYCLALYVSLLIPPAQENSREDHPEPIPESPSSLEAVSASSSLSEPNNEVWKWHWAKLGAGSATKCMTKSAQMLLHCCRLTLPSMDRLHFPFSNAGKVGSTCKGKVLLTGGHEKLPMPPHLLGAYQGKTKGNLMVE